MPEYVRNHIDQQRTTILLNGRAMNYNIVIWLKGGAHLDARDCHQRARGLKAALDSSFPRKKIGDRQPRCSVEPGEWKAPLLRAAAGKFTSGWISRGKSALKREFRGPANFYFCPQGGRPSLLADFSAGHGWKLCMDALQAAGVDTEEFRIELTKEAST